MRLLVFGQALCRLRYRPNWSWGARKKPDVACDTGLWSSEGAAKCHKRKGCPRSAFAQSSAMRPWHRGSAVKLDHNEIIGPLAWFGGADAPDEQRARASRTLSIADRRPSPSESSHFFSFWHSPRSMRSPIAKKRQNPLPSKGFGTLRPRWAIMGRNHQWRGQDMNLRPRGYEPRELPDCSTPRCGGATGCSCESRCHLNNFTRPPEIVQGSVEPFFDSCVSRCRLPFWGTAQRRVPTTLLRPAPGNGRTPSNPDASAVPDNTRWTG